MPLLPWAVLLGLLLQQPVGAPGNPRGVLRQALDAVENDSVGPLRLYFSGLADRSPPDRTALLVLGSIARLTYAYGQSDTLLARVVALGGDDGVADYARMEQGASLEVRGRFREAADAYAQALAGAERRGDTIATVEALLGLAGLRARQAGTGPAEQLLERAESLARGRPALEANLHCQRAISVGRTGARGALDLAEQGAELAWRTRGTRQEGHCWHAMAQVYLVRGDMEGADTALGRAAGLLRRARDAAALASVLQWRGYFYILLGRYGVAQIRLAQAMAQAERAQAGSVVGYITLNLGTVSLGVGDRLTAGQYFDRATALFQAQGDERGLITARNMAGNMARAAGDVSRARDQYTRVLEWADRTANVQTQLSMHERLGSLAQMERDAGAAEREYRTAQALARANGMKGWEASLRNDLGRLALERGDLRGAERELGTFLMGLAPEQHRRRYDTRALLAEAYIRGGEILRGESEILAAADEFDGWRASLSDRELRVRALETGEGIDPDLGVAWVIAALARAGRVGAAFQLADRHRARELTDQIYRAQAVQVGATPPVRRSAFLAGQVDAVGALPDSETALLEYVTGRGGEPTTLFVVTRAGIVAQVLAPVDSLQADLLRFGTVLEGGGDARALGARLGGALLGPAIAGLDPRIARLIIVPDDILARVAFDALVLADGRYAVERFAIGLVPSVSTLVAIQGQAGKQRPVRLLALGDPHFASPSAKAEVEPLMDPATPVYRSAFAAEGGLPRLAASGREARRVARYAPSAEVRLGDAASEAYLRSAPLDSFRVLHFATHALVNEEAVTRTALALAPGDGQDGFLGPADLAALNLQADLVVLSACRTAGGVVLKGEGIQGLTAPLLQAGARVVVATGWRIADQSAGRLVEAFYAGLAAGNSVGDALRAAKLEAIRAGAPPSEWAAFVAVGDPLVRIPLVPPGARRLPPSWLAAVAAGLALALLYGWIRKRSGVEPT